MTRDDGYTRYTVRIPTPLYEMLKEASGAKSVNAEIVLRLEASFAKTSFSMEEVRVVGGDDDPTKAALARALVALSIATRDIRAILRPANPKGRLPESDDKP